MKKSDRKECQRCHKTVKVVSEQGHCRPCVKKIVNAENRARAEARREEARRQRDEK